MTDSERADQIVQEITGAIVAHSLEAGEAWVKAKWDVLIPHKDFDILRRYHEWDRQPKRRRAGGGSSYDGMEQVVDLPKCRVYNGGTIQEIKIELLRGGGDYLDMNSILKDTYVKSIREMLDNSPTLLKKWENLK